MGGFSENSDSLAPSSNQKELLVLTVAQPLSSADNSWLQGYVLRFDRHLKICGLGGAAFFRPMPPSILARNKRFGRRFRSRLRRGAFDKEFACSATGTFPSGIVWHLR